MKSILSFLAVILISASSLFAQTGDMPKFQYKVKTDKWELNFQEVSGLDSDPQAMKYRHGNSLVYSTVKIPGLVKSGNVTCIKGRALNTKVMNTFLSSTKGTITKGTITIELFDEKGNHTLTWTFRNAYISKTVKGNELTIESITIVHEGVNIANE